MPKNQHPGPTLHILGPIRITDTTGIQPDRSIRQCEEYCAWLLRNPEQSTTEMLHALNIAEGTRRSNLCRLRTWLGYDPNGNLYLPDAYQGHIHLHPDVTSDWEHFEVTLTGGIKQATDDALATALNIINGPPFADGNPNQWGWTESWRAEIFKLVRDTAVELTQRALHNRNIDLARWAATTGIDTTGEDETLMILRLKTEHLAGNHTEVKRLAIHIARQAKHLGYQLSPQMNLTIQQTLHHRPPKLKKLHKVGKRVAATTEDDSPTQPAKRAKKAKARRRKDD